MKNKERIPVGTDDNILSPVAEWAKFDCGRCSSCYLSLQVFNPRSKLSFFLSERLCGCVFLLSVQLKVGHLRILSPARTWVTLRESAVWRHKLLVSIMTIEKQGVKLLISRELKKKKEEKKRKSRRDRKMSVGLNSFNKSKSKRYFNNSDSTFFYLFPVFIY